MTSAESQPQGVPADIESTMSLLGNVTNLEIIEFLRRRPHSHAAQIMDAIQASRPVLSRRLVDLERAGVIEADTDLEVGSRRGQLLHYQINETRLRQIIDSWSEWVRGS